MIREGDCPWCKKRVTIGAIKVPTGFAMAGWCDNCKVWAYHYPIKIVSSHKIHLPAGHQ